MNHGQARRETASEKTKAMMGTHPAAIRRRVEAMEKLLERMIPIPGTKGLGLDVILDLVPVGGSLISAGLGAYIAWEARNLGMPKRTIAKMAGNIGFDALLGAIPWVGAIPDFFFRSNSRNLKMIRRHLDKHHPATSVIDVEAR